MCFSSLYCLGKRVCLLLGNHGDDKPYVNNQYGSVNLHFLLRGDMNFPANRIHRMVCSAKNLQIPQYMPEMVCCTTTELYLSPEGAIKNQMGFILSLQVK